MLDVSASITTHGMTRRLFNEGKRLPGKWLIDGGGEVSDDPSVLFQSPPGALLPTGGVDHGHKGYGLALMVEALTQGLGGFGRAEGPTQWGASVFVQVIEKYADALTREISAAVHLPIDLEPWTIYGLALIILMYIMPMGIAGGLRNLRAFLGRGRRRDAAKEP